MLVTCLKTSKDIFHSNCLSFSASTSNSLDRRTASGWLPSSRALGSPVLKRKNGRQMTNHSHVFYLLYHYFNGTTMTGTTMTGNHDFFTHDFFILESCQAGFGNHFGRPRQSRVVSASKQQLPSLQVLDWSLASNRRP